MKSICRRWFLAIALIPLAAILSNCAGGQSQQPVIVKEEIREIQVQARNFAFEPNYIRISKTGTLAMKVENLADSMHNITVEDPQGKTIIDVDLPPHKVVRVEIELPSPGTYKFHCDKPLHSTFGMEGRIEVAP